MTRTQVWILALASLLVGAAIAWRLKPMATATPPSLVEIENMGHLVTVRVQFADVIDFTLPRAVGIPLSDYEIRYGGTTVLLIAKGDCSLATDLRLARYDKVDVAGRRLTVTLPSPVTLGARVNHAAPEQGGSRLYAVSNNGLEAFIPDPSNRNKAIEDAFRLAETRVSAACRNADAIRQAKSNAESLLSSMYRSTGWNVTYQWRQPSI